jgi:hypothetical protein
MHGDIVIVFTVFLQRKINFRRGVFYAKADARVS